MHRLGCLDCPDISDRENNPDNPNIPKTMLFARPLAELISELEKLPGVGPKSAQRLAYHLLRVTDHEANSLANAIRNAKQRLRFCGQCQNISESEMCEICLDGRRDRSTICVVAEPRDIAAIERIHEYRGLYHVLHGLLNPMDGIGPEQLRVKQLLERLGTDEVHEIILATNPTVEGEATAHYIAQLLGGGDLVLSRIAHGVPLGGELELVDGGTLAHALAGRRPISG